MAVSLQTLMKRVVRKLTARKGLLGDYDYGYLFTPDIPLSKNPAKTQPFFGLNSEMPIVLGLVLGFQHALAMLAGIITPPIIISISGNLSLATQQYLVSASLITSGILSIIQISRIRIFKTNYFIGTGLLSVVGTSFATITIVTKAFPMMYANGICPTTNGINDPCPDGYGMILATGSLCALLEILLSFCPPKILQKVFPPLVTGPVVLLIGSHLVKSGFSDWIGGSACVGKLCGVKNLPWGSAQFIGLGFSVYVSIILFEKWGSPIMKSCAVVLGLLVGCIVAAACGYFSSSEISQAPAVTFLWVHSFKLKIYAPAILPFLAVYIVLMMETIGDITATSDVSRLEVEGELYESRIQGGILADGLNSALSGLFTVTPMSVFAQNNGVISITKCANRVVGWWCAFFLIIMGIFSKFAAAIVSIPKPVLGGMTSFLFSSVAVSGIKIICSSEFLRRDRFIFTASILPGLGATLVPDWFDHVFTYTGPTKSLQGFLDAIVLIMETGFALTGIIGVILNLFIPSMSDDVEEINEVVLETIGSADERALQVNATNLKKVLNRNHISSFKQK